MVERAGYLTAAFRWAKQEAVRAALCLLVAAACGLVLLLDVPFKWHFAFLATLGVGVLMLAAGSPRPVMLFILAFAAPIYFGKAFIISPAAGSTANGSEIGLTDVLAAALLVIFLARLASGHAHVWLCPRIMLPALAWLMVCSMTLLVATDVELTAIGLINLVKLLLLSWAVALSVEDRTQVGYIVAGLLSGMLFQGVVGVYQGITGRPIGLAFLTETASVRQQMVGASLVNRVQGTMGHPNTYAMYLTTVIPFALALLLSTARPAAKAVAGLALGLAGPALIFSLSRSAWVNCIAVTGIVLGLAVRRRRISPGAASLLAGAGSMLLLSLVAFGPDLILSRITGDDSGSAQSRIVLARTALAVLADHPWLGIGLNNYMMVLPQYDAAAFITRTVVHNAYLLIAAETGLLGLAAYLGLVASLLVRAWRTVSQAIDETEWVASVGVFAAFVAFTLHSMTDYALFGSSRLLTQFWLLVGLAAGLSQWIGLHREAGDEL